MPHVVFSEGQSEKPPHDARTVRYVIAEPCITVKDNSCVEVCPVDAIFTEDQVPDEWERFTELNAAYYRNQAA